MSLEFVQNDIQRIISDRFSENITIETPDGNTNVQIQGFVSKHNLSVDPTNGLPVNGTKAHITVNELDLTEAGLVVRNSDNEVELNGYKVTFTVFERSLTFLINEVWPDEALGTITCTLGDYTNE